MAARDIETLDPAFRESTEGFLARCDAEAFDVLIYCCRRSPEQQAKLYRQGRSLGEIYRKVNELRDDHGRRDLAKLLLDVGPQHGRRVTNAGPGQSLHQYGLAFDGVPMRHGKPVWDDRAPENAALWLTYGEIAEYVGLDWAGRWVSFKEMPHVQARGVSWRDLIRNPLT
jgi:peptidoglycan L-alanyl-D-glutamate endopeptidase CwlK